MRDDVVLPCCAPLGGLFHFSFLTTLTLSHLFQSLVRFVQKDVGRFARGIGRRGIFGFGITFKFLMRRLTASLAVHTRHGLHAFDRLGRYFQIPSIG